MNDVSIFKRVEALNLPIGKYVVIGGVMEAYGLRFARDIDILVNKELFKQLKSEGWKRKWFFWRAWKCKMLVKGDAEAFSNYKYKKYKPDTDELIKNADIINGLPFLPLKELARFKTELARQKDIKDVELIGNYLKLHESDFSEKY
jgi:hypothetical protein